MANILVVEDELLIARLLKETLEIEGYQVVTVLNGEDAVQFALRETPQLIILDIMLPDIDGFEVIRRLREHPKSMHIPIIVLSALGEPEHKAQAFEKDVDDYITKPFHTEELLARVRRQLRRLQQSCLSPLTGLPGGLQVVRAINDKLGNSDPWSILYLDLDHFKAFNDVYGFLAGNDMIMLVGRICQQVVHRYGNAADFVGHVGGDDFIILTTPDLAETLCRQIVANYREESMAFYQSEDRERGFISGVDRKGRAYQFPLVSLSIGVVSSQQRSQLHTIQEVSSLAAEAKLHAKQATDNIYYASSRWTVGRQEKQERPSAARPGLTHTNTAFVPPSFSFCPVDNLHYALYRFVKENDLREFEPEPQFH